MIWLDYIIIRKLTHGLDRLGPTKKLTRGLVKLGREWKKHAQKYSRLFDSFNLIFKNKMRWTTNILIPVTQTHWALKLALRQTPATSGSATTTRRCHQESRGVFFPVPEACTTPSPAARTRRTPSTWNSADKGLRPSGEILLDRPLRQKCWATTYSGLR